MDFPPPEVRSRVDSNASDIVDRVEPQPRNRADSNLPLITSRKNFRRPGHTDDLLSTAEGGGYINGGLTDDKDIPKFHSADQTVDIPLKEKSFRPVGGSPSALSEIKSAEDVIELLENPGQFQLIQFVLMCLMYFTLSFNDLIPMFYSILPVVTCDPDYANSTVNENKTLSYKTTGEICYCPPAGVRYQYPDRQWSIVADMNLICDRAYLIIIPTIIYFLGNFVAGPLSGTLADKCGRRPALFIVNAIYTISSFGVIFSRDIVSFCILRFIVGLGRQGINSVGFVLMLEWMSPGRRGPGCAIALASVTFGALLLALLTYLIQNWWYIQIVLTVWNLWCIGLIWFGPESLKWLLLNNRAAQAKDIVRRIARFNKITIPENVYQRLDEIAAALQIVKEGGKPYSVSDWFRIIAIRRYIIITCWIWFVSFIVYLCFNLLVPPITPNLYANLAIGASLELFARIIAIVIARFHGNRMPLIWYFILTAIFALLAGMIPGSTPEEQNAKGAMIIFGRMVISMAPSVQFLFVQELFPTIVRNSAFGLCTIAQRIGDIIGSFLVKLAIVKTCIPDKVSTSGLPLEIIGLLAILGATATMFLPETRGKRMPETIQGAKERHAEIREKQEQLVEDVKKIE